MNRLQALRNASVINHPKIMPSRDRSEEEKRVTGMYQHLIEELQYILNRVENQRSAVDIRPGLLVELRLEREERERLARWRSGNPSGAGNGMSCRDCWSFRCCWRWPCGEA